MENASQNRSLLRLAVLAIALAIAGSASAQDVGREYDRGCDDAKNGSYDRSKHSDAYEAGWQECKKNAQAAPAAKPAAHNAEWKRGCSDAKDGSYDRSKHSADYEKGWQSCKAEQ